jgi:hypothetical protein
LVIFEFPFAFQGKKSAAPAVAKGSAMKTRIPRQFDVSALFRRAAGVCDAH